MSHVENLVFDRLKKNTLFAQYIIDKSVLSNKSEFYKNIIRSNTSFETQIWQILMENTQIFLKNNI